MASDARFVTPAPRVWWWGRSTQKDHIDLKIPAGIENGTRLRLRGRGESAPRGAGVDGDLLVEVRVKEHPWFERNGSDLIMSLPVAFPDLVLGTKVSIDHLDGDPIEIRIPEGSTSGIRWKCHAACPDEGVIEAMWWFS